MTTPLFWHLLILHLPAKAKAARMRVWRGLKAVGAAVLRDGVYLLPDGPAAERELPAQAKAVAAAGGSTHVWRFRLDDADEDHRLQVLFDRGGEFGELLTTIRALQARPPRETKQRAQRLRQLQRELDALAAIDYFPAEAQTQARAALADLERAWQAATEIGEPRAARGRIQTRQPRDYQRRQWATRKHLWVDRAASAWLIRRFIDPKARFVWLDDVKRCPAKALGFDYDGAAFTHVGARVSFETLLASFDLERDPALVKLGTLVHYLDVGGVPIAEAAGFAGIMKGARAAHPDDDDALLATVSPALDCLYHAYQQDITQE